MAGRTIPAALLLAIATAVAPVHAQDVRSSSQPERRADPQRQERSTQKPDEAQFDVTRLPVDLDRLQRKLQEAVQREDRGTSLRFTINVVGTAPPIRLVAPEDNLVFGKARYGGPSHRDMLNVVTPREFSPLLGGGAVISW